MEPNFTDADDFSFSVAAHGQYFGTLRQRGAAQQEHVKTRLRAVIQCFYPRG